MTKDVRIPVPGGSMDLEGRISALPLGAVVAPPHPLYGGHLSNPVVAALCDGLADRGIGALAFNWRGVGTSGGRPSGDPGIAAADYAAALAYVKASTPSPSPWVVAGYSFGAATALAVAAGDPSVGEVMVVAPPVAMLARDLKFAAACRLTVVAAAEDDFSPLEELRAAFAHIDGTKFVVVDGADHFFSTGGLEVIATAAAGGA
jgi:alpha/beta superfamily hydrolase